MKNLVRVLLSAAIALPLSLAGGGVAVAQKSGGTLRVYHRDSPGNMSIHEEGTISVLAPMMPVFTWSFLTSTKSRTGSTISFPISPRAGA